MSTEIELIHTRRFILRLSEKNDANVMTKMLEDPDVSGNIAIFKQPYEHKSSLDWCHMARPMYEAGNGLLLSILRKEDLSQVGCIALTRDQSGGSEWLLENSQQGNLDKVEGLKSGEIGYWIGKRFWRQGTALECAQSLLKHGFEALGYDYIHATTALDNQASSALLQKLGFTKMGEKERLTVNGKKRLSAHFSMVATSWKSEKDCYNIPICVNTLKVMGAAP